MSFDEIAFQKTKYVMLKKFFITISIFLCLELLSLIIISFLIQDDLKNWEFYVLPQRVNSLTWFEKHNNYHPYLTYAGKHFSKNLAKAKNNKNDSINIAILGGSFAELFADYLNSEDATSLRVAFTEQNNKKLKINFLNFATGYYSQPQQIITSILFLDHIDFFISIEGFNELEYKAVPCSPSSWNTQFLRFSEDRHDLRLMTGSFLKDIYLSMNQWLYTHISFLKLLFFNLEPKLYNYIQASQRSLIASKKKNCKEIEKPENENKVVNRWFSYVDKHQKLLSGVDKPIVTIIQPNQYFPDTKTWSPEEQKLFTGQEHRQSKLQKMYPLVMEKLSLLNRSSNLKILDFTKIYKDNSETIYFDGCCHVNDLGNKIFAKKMYDELKKLDIVSRLKK